ncbi:chorismate mutase [Burkholderia cepacia]|uniref:chorismate mutase n=1 Tax=Burkholderia cepacia TaxID=292 RepID=UPI0015899703|nr:chorismate mutase [Burkholderia cepacia]
MKVIFGRTRSRRIAEYAFSTCIVSGCLPAIGAPANAFVPLVRSIADRLDTAAQVALSKWDTGQAVCDPKREAQVIANASVMAASLGLTTDDAANIFTDQIEASKEVQYALLNTWRRDGGAPATPRQSLTDVIRPELDKLQVSILQNLQDVGPLRSSADCQTLVAIAVGKIAQEKALDTLRLVALDRATAHICIRS